MDSEIKPRLLTLKEASKYSGININSLKLYVYRNELTSIKIHKRRYLDRRVLDEWIDSHSTERKIIQFRR